MILLEVYGLKLIINSNYNVQLIFKRARISRANYNHVYPNVSWPCGLYFGTFSGFAADSH